MDEPLTESQQRLRGYKISNMAIYQLHDWISACRRMAHWAKSAQDRTIWKTSGQEALTELERRLTA
jgi:hypothetical protein